MEDQCSPLSWGFYYQEEVYIYYTCFFASVFLLSLGSLLLFFLFLLRGRTNSILLIGYLHLTGFDRGVPKAFSPVHKFGARENNPLCS